MFILCAAFIKKGKLWSESINLKNKFPSGLWYIVEDFNIVTKGRERKGSSVVFYQSLMLEFQDL